MSRRLPTILVAIITAALTLSLFIYKRMGGPMPQSAAEDFFIAAAVIVMAPTVWRAVTCRRANAKAV